VIPAGHARLVAVGWSLRQTIVDLSASIDLRKSSHIWSLRNFSSAIGQHPPIEHVLDFGSASLAGRFPMSLAGGPSAMALASSLTELLRICLV
jgi:hypothetical protein